MITRGMSVRVHAASGAPTAMIGVVTRLWTNEATREQWAEVALCGRRWSGPAGLLQRIEQISDAVQLAIPPGVRR